MWKVILIASIGLGVYLLDNNSVNGVSTLDFHENTKILNETNRVGSLFTAVVRD